LLLPHVIVRFFTVAKVRDARKSAGLALLLIAILYTTAPVVSVFARTNLIDTVSEKEYSEIPGWFKNWEDTGLIAWADKNNDGKIQYLAGSALDGKKPVFTDERGAHRQRVINRNFTDVVLHDSLQNRIDRGDGSSTGERMVVWYFSRRIWNRCDDGKFCHLPGGFQNDSASPSSGTG